MKIRIELADRELRLGKEQLIAALFVAFGLSCFIDSWEELIFLVLTIAAGWLGLRSTTRTRRPTATTQRSAPAPTAPAPQAVQSAATTPSPAAPSSTPPPGDAKSKREQLHHSFLVAQAETNEEYKNTLRELQMYADEYFDSEEGDEDDEDDEDEDENTEEAVLLERMRRDELISALKNLGYKQTSVAIADHVMSQHPGAELETLIRAALQFARKK
jgi:hypothetical protein